MSYFSLDFSSLFFPGVCVSLLVLLLHGVPQRFWVEFESQRALTDARDSIDQSFASLSVCQPIALQQALGGCVSLARFQDLALAHWTHSARKDRVQRGIHHLQHRVIRAPLPTSYRIQEKRWQGRLRCKKKKKKMFSGKILKLKLLKWRSADVFLRQLLDSRKHHAGIFFMVSQHQLCGCIIVTCTINVWSLHTGTLCSFPADRSHHTCFWQILWRGSLGSWMV